MNQRDVRPKVAAPGARGSGHPLPLLSPVSVVWHRLRGERRALPGTEAGGLVAMGDGRWFLGPGLYRVTSGILIEQTDLTDEQMRDVIQPAAVGTPDSDEKEASRVRTAQMVEAYRAKLGEPPGGIPSAMGAWLVEFGEDTVREAIIETAAAVAPHDLKTIEERYQFLRSALGHRRSRARRRPPGQTEKP